MFPTPSNPIKAPVSGGYLHPHALVNQHMPKEYYDYESATVEWGTVEPYEVSQKIGRGKYSEVFRGRNRNNGEICVVKVLKPVKSKKIFREITILQHLFGGPNVIRLLDIAQEPETEIPVFVFENVDNLDFRMLYPQLTNNDIKYYIFEVLKCLDFCHSMGIMHRDIKPHNIMIDHPRRKLRVIDWGLGEYYHHGTPYNVRVASRYYKGPELLVGFRYYDYSLDIWSLGCLLGGILFKKEPLFQGRDNNDQLVQIVNVLGSEGLSQYIDKYDMQMPNGFDESILTLDKPKRLWTSLVKSSCSSLCDPEALDLLEKMLQYDHQGRILPRDAMNHPYFDVVRSECLSFSSSGKFPD